MKTVANFFIWGFVLWAASKLFPATVQISSWLVLLEAVVLLWITQMIITALGYLIVVLGAATASCTGIIAGLLVITGTTVIALYFLTAALGGFAVVGFWAKVLIALTCGLLCLPFKKSRREDP